MHSRLCAHARLVLTSYRNGACIHKHELTMWLDRPWCHRKTQPAQFTVPFLQREGLRLQQWHDKYAAQHGL